ncbi:sigma-70 family RNA polymerase sigma factor [Cupriavidus necator]
MNSALAPGLGTFSRLFRMAVIGGVEAAVKLHIERGDDLEVRDERGNTPLMLAAAKNRSGVCRILLEAGADPFPTDLSGKDALCIAKTEGADDAASAIEAFISRGSDERDQSGLGHSSIDASNASRSESELVLVSGNKGFPEISAHLIVDGTTADGSWQSESIEAHRVSADENDRTMFIDEGNPLDVSGWETEESSPPPVGAPSLVNWQIEAQKVIATHEPIDVSVDWEHFEIFLPDEAVPLPRTDDVEFSGRIRQLLLRAFREGSVPEMALADLYAGLGGRIDPGALSLLHFALNDMGAETDERFEYLAPHESFEVFVNPRENEAESDGIGAALAFLDNLAERNNDPMRLYMKEVQRIDLLTADEEIALAKAIDAAERDVIDALASWPEGLRNALIQIDLALASGRPIGGIAVGRRDDAEPEPDVLIEGAGQEDFVSLAGANLVGDEGSDEDVVGDLLVADLGGVAGADGFFDKIKELSVAIEQEKESVGAESARRGMLESLGLKRTFLLELADTKAFMNHESAGLFIAAAQRLARARSRMATANLRLVLTIAKRYLFSGLPMDDLVQEGNIGLLKAVDKFDWRRGYRFSTMATWWIRQQVSRSVADDSRTIRLPVHVYEQLQRLEREAYVIERSEGREPSTAELAARLSLQADKVEILRRAAAPVVSLHDEDDCGDLVHGSIEDAAADPFESVASGELRATLGTLLSALGGKHERVLRMRFGLGADDALTLEEVGARFEVTRERIRQIEGEALRRLRKRRTREMFRGWVCQADPEEIARACAQESSAELEVLPPRSAPNAEIRHEAPTNIEMPSRREESDGKQQRSAINRLLAEAAALGIAIEEDQNGDVRSTWVNIDKAIDTKTRSLIRKLIGIGFVHWPGRGYWI